jgi:L-aspartate oxidase
MGAGVHRNALEMRCTALGQERREGASMTDQGEVSLASQANMSRSDVCGELECDVVIVGGGVAGLSVALSLPAGLRVALVTKAALGESNTRYAQGGLAVAVGLDDDPALHLRDTLAAGAGLVHEAAARVLVEEGPEAAAWLIGIGAQFDERSGQTRQTPSIPAPRALAERYALGREAAHSRRRVLHAHGDATGAEIERALVAAIRTRPGTTVLEQAHALDLLVEDGCCLGVVVWHRGAQVAVRAARGTVLANGGAGQLWLRTSNPAGATADGVALAWRAGAALADLEFVQFHPTVLVPPTGGGDPFLISEAVRGEGAWLRNAAGERFTPRYHADAELAPRDVVARAILSEMLTEGAPSAFLDLRHLPAEAMRQRFPTIAAACARYGLDLARDLIPVAPAAHYFMGGVVVDTWARTTLPNLYAVGEVACTGVHGANRLASNSLLEGLVFGRRAAAAMSETHTAGDTETDLTAEAAKDAEEGERTQKPLIAPSASSGSSAVSSPSLSAWPEAPVLPGDFAPGRVVEPTVHAGDVAGPARWALRQVMWEHAALRRDATGLLAAQSKLRRLAAAGPVDHETSNMLVAAQLIVAAALARRESRGGHFRVDYPHPETSLAGRHTLLAGRSAAAATAAFVVAAGRREDANHA